MHKECPPHPPVQVAAGRHPLASYEAFRVQAMGDEKMHKLPPPPMSSRPPPLPHGGFGPLPPIPVPLPPPSYEELLGIADDGTPISTDDEAPNTPPMFGARPLPPPPSSGGDADVTEEAPPSSKPPISSSRKFAIAPNLPQIPKPIVNPKPIEHAPGIVSTQAFPLTEPPRKFRQTPIFVGLMFMLVGGLVAAVVFLFVKPKHPAASGASGESAFAASQNASSAPSSASPPVVSGEANGVAPGLASASEPAPPASATSAASPITSAPVASVAAQPSPAQAPAPASTAPRIKPKPKPTSDRIED